MPNVLLLRTPKADDRYDSIFQEAGLLSVSVPVLATSFCNAEELEALILSGGNDKYAGVVVTSGRAAEALNAAREAIACAKNNHLSDVDDTAQVSLQRGPSVALAPSSPLPGVFYVVGKATAAALIHSKCPPSAQSIRGQESGNGEALASFIINDIERIPGPLLYLTGDKNRDVLPSMLQDAGIELRQIQVYITHGSSTFEDDLSQVLQAHEAKHWWIVFFAPSAAEFTVPILQSRFDISVESEWPKIAAIGPTTAEFLRNKMKIKVDVVANSPTPTALLESIKTFVFSSSDS